MTVIWEEQRKREEFHEQIAAGTQTVLAALEIYDRSIRSIILQSIDRELAIRSAAYDAVHRPEWYAQLQDETPAQLGSPEFDQTSR